MLVGKDDRVQRGGIAGRHLRPGPNERARPGILVFSDAATMFRPDAVRQLVRHFALPPAAEVAVGFMAQSPEGEGCQAMFDSIRYRTERLSDLRSGE